MTRSLLFTLFALPLTACGQPDAEPEAAEPGADASSPEAAAQAEAPPEDPRAPSVGQWTPPPEESELDAQARVACMADDETFADSLPEGSAFAARHPDGRTRIACAIDDRQTWVVRAEDLQTEAIRPMRRAVSDHLRHGTERGADASMSGFHRNRSGAYCAIQTAPEMTQALCGAAREHLGPAR